MREGVRESEGEGDRETVCHLALLCTLMYRCLHAVNMWRNVTPLPVGVIAHSIVCSHSLLHQIHCQVKVTKMAGNVHSDLIMKGNIISAYFEFLGAKNITTEGNWSA